MKKIISIILSLAMLLSITSVTSLTTDAATEKPVVTISSVSASPGDEVELSVSLSGAPELSLIVFAEIIYDETQLSFISAYWDEKGPEDYDYNEDITDLGAMVRSSDKPIDLNKKIATFKFKVIGQSGNSVKVSIQDVGMVDSEYAVASTLIPGTVTIKSADGEHSKPSVRPIFDDKIALEYSVDLPGVTAVPNVTISVDGVEVSKTTATKTKDGKWSFTCLDIVPSKLDAQITVDIEGSDIEIPSYSIKDYCVERLANSADETYKQLISDLLRYGAVAQEFETNVASDMADVANILPVKSDVVPYENKFEKIGENKEEKVWKGATLILKNTITMRLYYNGDDAPDINSISCKSHHSVSVNIEKKCIEITGFTPLDYDEEITAIFKGATVKYSVGSYISRMSVSGNDLTKRIVDAIQNYGRAAEAYALSSNQSN